MSISRYAQDRAGDMEEYVLGDWVDYADHVEIVEKLEALLTEQEHTIWLMEDNR